MDISWSSPLDFPGVARAFSELIKGLDTRDGYIDITITNTHEAREKTSVDDGAKKLPLNI